MNKKGLTTTFTKSSLGCIILYKKGRRHINYTPFFKGAGKTITNTATCTDGTCTTTTAEEANTLGIIIINETNGSNNNNVAMATAGRRKKSMYRFFPIITLGTI